MVIAGIDEVGRGSLAGPVAAAAVVVKKRTLIKGVKDSKLLSQKQREEIFERIKDNPNIEWQVSYIYPKVIDKINIGQATLLAWKRSLKKLSSQPSFLFLDGNQTIPGLGIEQKAIIKGDQKIFLVSLASIIAKVNRDRLMEKLDKKYPQYGFFNHKGYGTKHHLEMIRKFGPAEIHRRSFRPVFDNLLFKDKVYHIVSRIPRGKTISYREVSERIGHPMAFRAVGNVLNKNPYKWVPCHRVIRSDGKIGGFAQGSRVKREMLRGEGAKVN
ncbi:MAG: ribonuclease HII [Candidatus Portnoybacteria bacterium]